MYKIIRASSLYEVVIIETNEIPKQFYRYEGSLGPESIEEISERYMAGYFSGNADGMGFGELPTKYFSSIEEVLTWVVGKRIVAAEKQIENFLELEIRKIQHALPQRQLLEVVPQALYVESDGTWHQRSGMSGYPFQPRDTSELLQQYVLAKESRKLSAEEMKVRRGELLFDFFETIYKAHKRLEESLKK